MSALLQVRYAESSTYIVAVTISTSVLTEVIDCVIVTESTSVDVCVCTETTVTDCVVVIESISMSVAVVVAVVDTVIVACGMSDDSCTVRMSERTVTVEAG